MADLGTTPFLSQYGGVGILDLQSPSPPKEHMGVPIPYEVQPEAIQVRIRQSLRNPNVGTVTQVCLKAGPRTFRFATIYQILDGKTGRHHHYCLRIDTFSRTRSGGWTEKPERSVLLESESSDELTCLVTFIQSVTGGVLPLNSGEYRVLEERHFERLKDLLGLVRSSDGARRLKILQAILSSLDSSSITGENWLKLFDAGRSEVLRSVAVAARMVEYRRAYTEIATLVEDPNASEAAFQRILTEHPWMFGSEYSELVTRRTWTRDDRLDFMLRRTVDAYLEIIEIKTPLRKALFRYDESHDSYAPCAELSTALGQVVRYIEEVERSRDAIIAKDGVDPLKIRARIIIGRDGNSDQARALRNFNGHLHRIEVVTFDQLLRVAGRVIEVFEETITVGNTGMA